MRGHVYRRGATWSYMIDVGYGPDGRRRQKAKGGFAKRKEAHAALTEALAALQHGTYVEAVRLTVQTYLLEHWLPASVSRVRQSTHASYEMHVRRYLVPGLGHLALQKVTAPAINALYAEIGKRLSPASVRLVHATLHRSLADAVRWQLVPRNVATLADPPRASRPQMAVWSPEQLRIFLVRTADDQYATLWLFYALTGVRRGEALALRWADVDLDARRVHICRNVVPVRSKLVFGEPKTARGRRSIALDPGMVAALRAHRRVQLEERVLMGPAFEDHDLVFARPDGSPWNPEYITRTFARLVRQTGLPHIRLHDVRHTHATLALVAGVPTRVVSDRLGHSAMAITTDVYQHVLPELEEDAAVRVAQLVFDSDEHGRPVYKPFTTEPLPENRSQKEPRQEDAFPARSSGRGGT